MDSYLLAALHTYNEPRKEALWAIDITIGKLSCLATIREHLDRRYSPEEYPRRLKLWLGELDRHLEALERTVRNG